MIVHDVQQGGSKWLSLRAGIPSASQFSRIITPSGGKSKSWEPYLYELLGERIQRHPAIEAPSLWWANRGKELEPQAIQFYELTRGVETSPIGFITSDDGRRGASPDRRVVGVNGICEFKCQKESLHMMFLMQSGLAYEEHRIQVQGQLNVCKDMEWDDLVSYHPELPVSIARCVREPEFQAKLDSLLTKFSDELDEKWEFCKAQGWTTEAAVQEEASKDKFSQSSVLDAVRSALIDTQKACGE